MSGGDPRENMGVLPPVPQKLCKLKQQFDLENKHFLNSNIQFMYFVYYIKEYLFGGKIVAINMKRQLIDHTTPHTIQKHHINLKVRQGSAYILCQLIPTKKF